MFPVIADASTAKLVAKFAIQRGVLDEHVVINNHCHADLVPLV